MILICMCVYVCVYMYVCTHVSMCVCTYVQPNLFLSVLRARTEFLPTPKDLHISFRIFIRIFWERPHLQDSHSLGFPHVPSFLCHGLDILPLLLAHVDPAVLLPHHSSRWLLLPRASGHASTRAASKTNNSNQPFYLPSSSPVML